MDIDYEIGHRHGRGIHRCDRNASDENRGPGRGHNRDREHDLDRVLDQRQDQDRE